MDTNNTNGLLFTISGKINNLTTSGMVLQNNNSDPLTIASGATSFSLTQSYSSGTTYSIKVSNPPTGQSCTITNGTGTIAANVTDATLGCCTSGSFDTSFNGIDYDEGNCVTVDSFNRVVAVGVSCNGVQHSWGR